MTITRQTSLEAAIGGMEANGPPPKEALCFYEGEVMHARMAPFAHRFAYHVFSILIDIDRLDEAASKSRLFGINRAGLMSFHEADHVAQPGMSLRAFIEDQLDGAGLDEAPGRILLNCYPRVLGYVFNPLSVYYVYGKTTGSLIAAIYEVRNTFKQRHTYVAAVRDGELSDAGLKQRRTKIFHVSPFIPLGPTYDFRILPPGKVLRTRIMERDRGKPLLSATFHGRYRALDGIRVAVNALRFPFMTLSIVAAIHWQALKLWLKGAKYHSIPKPPEPVSYGLPFVANAPDDKVEGL